MPVRVGGAASMGCSQAAKENPIAAAMTIIAMLRIASKHFIVFFIKTILII
jgi:hypothetical protein